MSWAQNTWRCMATLGGHDRLQIVATENNTSVTVDGAVVAVLQAGESHSHELNTPSAFIESSAPVAVWQSTGFGCELGGGQLPSVKCTGSNSTVFVRSTPETMRLNVLVPAGGQGDFLFNGNAGVLTAGMFACSRQHQLAVRPGHHVGRRLILWGKPRASKTHRPSFTLASSTVARVQGRDLGISQTTAL